MNGLGPGTRDSLAAKVGTRAMDDLPKYKVCLGSSLDPHSLGGLAKSYNI